MPKKLKGGALSSAQLQHRVELLQEKLNPVKMMTEADIEGYIRNWDSKEISSILTKVKKIKTELKGLLPYVNSTTVKDIRKDLEDIEPNVQLLEQTLKDMNEMDKYRAEGSGQAGGMISLSDIFPKMSVQSVSSKIFPTIQTIMKKTKDVYPVIKQLFGKAQNLMRENYFNELPDKVKDVVGSRLAQYADYVDEQEGSGMRGRGVWMYGTSQL